jgi:hypothetical protein
VATWNTIHRQSRSTLPPPRRPTLRQRLVLRLPKYIITQIIGLANNKHHFRPCRTYNTALAHSVCQGRLYVVVLNGTVNESIANTASASLFSNERGDMNDTSRWLSLRSFCIVHYVVEESFESL